MIATQVLQTPDGAAVGVRHAGSIGPALVFVHGVGSTAAIWDMQLAAFADRYRCFSIELRGNGVPPDPDPSLITRPGFASDVLTVLDWAGVERATLVGCSLGGVVGFELWSRAPERIESYVIVGSFAKYPDGQVYADGVKEAVRAAGDMTSFARMRAAKLSMPPDREAETIEQMALKSVTSYLASTQATWTGDYTAVLLTITVRSLVTCGERDAVAPPALSRAIASGIPGSRYELVPDAGHVANADNPQAFNAMLEKFLA